MRHWFRIYFSLKGLEYLIINNFSIFAPKLNQLIEIMSSKRKKKLKPDRVLSQDGEDEEVDNDGHDSMISRRHPPSGVRVETLNLNI